MSVPTEGRLPTRTIHRIGDVSVETVYEEPEADRLVRLDVKPSDVVLLSVPEDHFSRLDPEFLDYLSRIRELLDVAAVVPIPKGWRLTVVGAADRPRAVPEPIIPRPSE